MVSGGASQLCTISADLTSLSLISSPLGKSLLSALLTASSHVSSMPLPICLLVILCRATSAVTSTNYVSSTSELICRHGSSSRRSQLPSMITRAARGRNQARVWSQICCSSTSAECGRGRELLAHWTSTRHRVFGALWHCLASDLMFCAIDGNRPWGPRLN